MAGTAALTLTLAACGSEDESPEAGDDPTSTTSESETTGADETFTDDKCTSKSTSADTYKVGGILPLTGNLAYLGPPEIAGVGLAVSDINAAGGVAGADACHLILDSGDTTDLSVSTATADRLINAEPSIVVGAASSSVSLNVVDSFTDAKIVQVSPANTAVDLSGYSPYYFRTAPPDGIQGSALGTLISSDGYSRVAFLTFSDTYGTGLRNAVQETLESSGGECVYGCKGDGDEFPAGQTTFSSDVSAALATNPDAIVILAFDETKAIVPELVNQGWDMSKTYLSDGNTADYSEDFPAGTLEGAQGTIPGADASEDFKQRLQGWNQQVNGEELSDYAYAAESYDAAILGALAAAKGGSTDPDTIRENYAAVSGANGGEECTTYADCLALIEDGSDIQYAGPSGIGPIDEENDPSSAFVGIYTYDGQNKNQFSTTVEGNKQ